MKRFFDTLLITALIGAAGLFFNAQAVESWTQTLMNDLASGASAKGAGVLQTGEVSTLSAVASNTTLVALVAAPASGQTYVRGIWIEKFATSTGAITLTSGTTTTTECDTGAATAFTISAAAAQLPPFGYQPIGIRIPAGKKLCGSTEGTNTAFRVLAQ